MLQEQWDTSPMLAATNHKSLQTLGGEEDDNHAWKISTNNCQKWACCGRWALPWLLRMCGCISLSSILGVGMDMSPTPIESLRDITAWHGLHIIQQYLLCHHASIAVVMIITLPTTTRRKKSPCWTLVLIYVVATSTYAGRENLHRALPNYAPLGTIHHLMPHTDTTKGNWHQIYASSNRIGSTSTVGYIEKLLYPPHRNG